MESLKGALALVLCGTLCMPSPMLCAQSPAQSADRPAAPHQHRPAYDSTQLQGNERILQALNRFTFGPRPGDLETVQAMGLDAWFEKQLQPSSIDQTDLNARLAQFPAMQWSVPDLLYRIPSNAVIRQAIDGRAQIPSRGTLHAVYENQIYRLQEKKAAQQEKKQADAENSAPAQAAKNQAAPANDMAEPAPSDQARNSSSGAKNAASVSSTAILNQLDQLDMPMADNATVQKPAAAQLIANDQPGALDDQAGNQALFREVVMLQGAKRVLRLQSMQPEEFDAFFKSLRPIQRRALDEGLSPDLREAVSDLENPQRLVVEELIAQRLTRDIYSSAQLQEVMTDFWFNHFNIYLRKNEQMPYYLVSYERDVIRPHALGKFQDLLEAVAHSPAMLIYLDNAESIGPDSLAAERAKMIAWRRPNNKAKAPEGINENYARELMELHTLGVNGGYTQADVIQAARVLTGWTVDQPGRGGGFVFNENRHEPGTKTVLGKKIKNGGQKEGEELLHILASRPAAAQFLSKELAIRFVSDDPPQSLIDRMAKTYMSSGGDISAVMRTLFHSPELWAASDYRAKVKTPLEFVVSAARAGNADVENFLPLINALRQMGMPLYGCIPPTGYKWDAAEWVSTGSLVDRMNFALNLAANRLPGITVKWSSPTPPASTPNVGLLANPGASPDDPTPESEEARLEPLIVAGGVSAATRSAALQQFQAQIAQDSSLMRPVSAIARPQNRAKTATTLERQDQVLAGLLIGSPEFQRR
ncbi:MAG TPA: DUF1800 domain-containing protein [Terracidiphilus sp.]|nr:DUF1800 domain-containing protein [Terracidiphilus sp.]